MGSHLKQLQIKQEQKKPKDNNETKKQIKAETKLVKISQPKKKKAKKRRSFDTKNFIASNLKISKTIGKFNLTNIDLALKKTYDSF